MKSVHENHTSKKKEPELSDLVQELLLEQRRLIRVVEDLRQEHQELKDEIKIQNFVLNNFSFRTEVLN